MHTLLHLYLLKEGFSSGYERLFFVSACGNRRRSRTMQGHWLITLSTS